MGYRKKTLSSVATEPELEKPTKHRTRSTRPKVSRSRSQQGIHHNGRRRGRIRDNNPYQPQPTTRSSSREPTRKEPSARELERQKRRGSSGSGNSGNSGNSNTNSSNSNHNNNNIQRRERMNVWEEKQSNSDAEGTTTTKSDGARQQQQRSSRNKNDRPVVSNGWAERLKMYLKTPRSRFGKKNNSSNNSNNSRSRSKSPSKNGDQQLRDKSKLSRTPNQPTKTTGKTRSASSVPMEIPIMSVASPEGKQQDAPQVSMFMSPPPTTSSSGSVPKKSRDNWKKGQVNIHIDTTDNTGNNNTSNTSYGNNNSNTTTRSPEVNYADENSHSERKMTPLPKIEKREKGRWSPPPARNMCFDENIKVKSHGAEEGRRALSRLNSKITKKKKSRNGPVVNSRFFQKSRTKKK